MKKIPDLLSISLILGLNSAAIAQTKATEPAVQKQETRLPEIFAYVEQMPEFMGGQTALVNYLSSNIKYPEAEQEAGNQGKAIVKFIVNEDGVISNVEVVRSTGSKALDAEAKRVVTSMPNWKPGKQNGKAVKTYFNLPIVFRLAADEKQMKK